MEDNTESKKILIRVVTRYSHNLWFLKKKLQGIRGFWRNPLFCFAAMAAVLFGFAVFSPYHLQELGSASSLGAVKFPAGAGIEKATISQGQGGVLAAKIFVKEPPLLSIIQNDSLAAATPVVAVTPQILGSLLGDELGYGDAGSRREILEYIVESGDTLYAIASRLDVSLETILWANELNKNSNIQPGQKLIILPVSGVIHYVKRGDTISEIAQKYKGDVNNIIAFNGLSGEGDISIGDILIVPAGVMPAPVIKYAFPSPIPLGSSYFICPVSSPCRITQGLHWYNAMDFSNGSCGEPIFAAAQGQVLKVRLTSSRSRWAFGGAGNHMTILHPNGVVTFYGHIQTSLVNPGDYVSQGQIIALVGGQPGASGAGRSTGCHVHFGVVGAKNPFAR